MNWLDIPLFDKVTPLAIMTFILLMMIAVIVARIGNSLIRKYLDETGGKRLSKSVARAYQYIIMFTALGIGFGTVLRLDLSAIFLSLGIMGLAIAFASQQIIQNAISGVLISFIRPIQLEDWVEVGPIPLNGMGRVKDITLMNTVLRDIDGRIVTVPNTQIMNGKVINHTRGGFTSVNVPLWIADTSDLDRIITIVREEADRDPNVLPKVSDEGRTKISKLFERQYVRGIFGSASNLHSLTPEVYLAEVQGTRSRVNIKVWIIEPFRRDEIISNFLRRLASRLRDEGIELRDP